MSVLTWSSKSFLQKIFFLFFFLFSLEIFLPFWKQFSVFQLSLLPNFHSRHFFKKKYLDVTEHLFLHFFNSLLPVIIFFRTFVFIEIFHHQRIQDLWLKIVFERPLRKHDLFEFFCGLVPTDFLQFFLDMESKVLCDISIEFSKRNLLFEFGVITRQDHSPSENLWQKYMR